MQAAEPEYMKKPSLRKNFLLNLICFPFLFGAAEAYTQELPVRFKIINSNKEPVPFASAKIISVPDTMQLQQGITDSSGVAVFTLINDHLYKVQVTSINYKTIEKNIKLTGTQTTFILIAESFERKLDNVVVTSTRPLLTQEDDKTIVDPENLAASSTNAYEIIEKTPGLFVDQDGNIYLSSTTPALIYINGRELKMSAPDVATMLKSLPPNAIASIEIMRTPSAKYDASGSGGIVNVILKKGIKIGLTGSINAGLNQGNIGTRLPG